MREKAFRLDYDDESLDTAIVIMIVIVLFFMQEIQVLNAHTVFQSSQFKCKPHYAIFFLLSTTDEGTVLFSSFNN